VSKKIYDHSYQILPPPRTPTISLRSARFSFHNSMSLPLEAAIQKWLIDGETAALQETFLLDFNWYGRTLGSRKSRWLPTDPTDEYNLSGASAPWSAS